MSRLGAGGRLLTALLGLAVSNASAQTASSATPDLGGTSWQLVRFQDRDDRTLTPDDRAKYTLRFETGGRLSARIDCNRGAGSWRAPGPGQLELGPLALTRAQCPPDSLHDRIVRDLAFIRSYVVKDGHLFLSLQADAGIYEYEPIAGGATATPAVPVASRARSEESPAPCA